MFSKEVFSVPLFQLGLHVGDPAVVEVNEEEAEGGGGQEPLPGKIAHQAQSFVTRQAEMMLLVGILSSLMGYTLEDGPHE